MSVKESVGIMSKTKKTALGGLITAFSSILMISSNLIPLGLYVFPAIAGIVIYIFSCLAGKAYAWSSYVAVAIVSFILCTDKETVLCFIFFLGYYPIVKAYIEKIKLKLISYILKFIMFNVAVGIIYLILFFVFGISADEFEIFGVNVPLLFLILLNITFVMYDFSLSLFERNYKQIIVKKITKIFR